MGPQRENKINIDSNTVQEVVNMPDIRNCKRCGRIFNYIGGIQFCPACRDKDEEDYKRVKEYLYENPKASVSQVSMDLDISVEQIKRYLRDGRLEIVDEAGNLFLECEACGKAIRSGRFCTDCERTLSRDLSTAAEEIKHKLSKDVDTQRSGWIRYLSKEEEKKEDKK